MYANHIVADMLARKLHIKWLIIVDDESENRHSYEEIYPLLLYKVMYCA